MPTLSTVFSPGAGSSAGVLASTASSAASVAESTAIADSNAASTAQSEALAVSTVASTASSAAVVASTSASTANSLATAVSTVASTGSSVAAVASSAAVVASTSASTANSVATATSTSDSGANSKATSAGTLASTASSVAALALPLAGGTMTGNLKAIAGTATVAPITLQSGTNLTTPIIGGVEFDGVNFYHTIDTTSGRAFLPAIQFFHLTASASAIGPSIANFFGTTSNISLVASGYYEIEIIMWFTKTTTEAVTITLTNSSAPTSQNIYFEMSPVGALVAPPGTATMLVGQIINDATAARTIVTGSLTTTANFYARIRIFLKNGSGTSLKIQTTCSAGTVTPLIGSQWTCTRKSPNNIGTFAA